MLDDNFALTYHALEYANLDRTFRKDGVYRRRWQWWLPWGVTRPWLPRWFYGADEWCNPSVCLVIPPFGCLVIFWHFGRLQTTPCGEDWSHMNDFERADYSPCGFLHDGRISHRRHHHAAAMRLCPVAREWLKVHSGDEHG
jgi:hypothetical protein